MQIILKQLRIKNFKGITAMVVNFFGITNIFGANGTGKTSIADAWFWSLFGKNSSDEKDFNVKNTVQVELNELDHEVEAVIFIDGEETTLRHVYREIWRKKTGDPHKTYQGNENEYYWNGVPCKLKDWNAKIEKILSADIFKKITHPGYFNSIPWQQRRETLIAMAGPVSDSEIVGDDQALLKLLASMGKKTVKEYQGELAARKSKLKDDLKHLPARIDELKQSLPATEPNFDALQLQVKQAAADLNEIDVQLTSKTAAQTKWQNEQSAIQKEIHRLNRNLADLENRLRIELENQDRNAAADITAQDLRIKNLHTSIAQLGKDKVEAEERIQKHDATMASLREEWKSINARKFDYQPFEFNEAETVCSHCKQPLPASDVTTRKATLLKNYNDAKDAALIAFNKSKERELSDNNINGQKAKAAKVEVEGFLLQITDAIAKKQAELTELETLLASLKAQYTQPLPIADRLAEVLKNNKEALAINAAVNAQKALVKEEPTEDNAELKTRKTELTNLLSSLNQQLGQRDHIANTKVRIDKLIEDEKFYSQKLAAAEGEEYLVLQYEKLRMERINARVNGLFKYVKFKLFETNIDGGEKPCCETMINGVPYSDLNTAGRMKAGIDIINALSKHYNVYAPIFLDNRESVTEIPETESQVINFVVSKPDKKLRIEESEMMEVA